MVGRALDQRPDLEQGSGALATRQAALPEWKSGPSKADASRRWANRATCVCQASILRPARSTSTAARGRKRIDLCASIARCCRRARQSPRLCRGRVRLRSRTDPKVDRTSARSDRVLGPRIGPALLGADLSPIRCSARNAFSRAPSFPANALVLLIRSRHPDPIRVVQFAAASVAFES